MAGDQLLAVAERLREALFTCAVERLGLGVREVDLRVTALRDKAEDSSAATGPVEVTVASAEDDTARAAAAVPGVAYRTRTLGSAVARSPGHVRVELATAARYRPPVVARAVRRAVQASASGDPSVAVLITGVGVTS